MRAKVSDEQKSLKTLILANINRRLPLSDSVTSATATLLDPSMKTLVNMRESKKEELLYTAVTECRERADQQTSVDNDDVAAVNSSQLSALLSKKFKLVRKHAPELD